MNRTIVALALLAATLAHTAPAFAFNIGMPLGASTINTPDRGAGSPNGVSEASLGSGR